MDPETPLHFRPILDHLISLFEKVDYSYEKFYKLYYSKEEESLFEDCEDSLKKITCRRASIRQKKEETLTEIIYLRTFISSEEEKNADIDARVNSFHVEKTNQVNQLDEIESKFLEPLHRMVCSKETEHDHSQSKSLPRFMFRISSAAILISFATIIAILTFFPTPLLAALLTLVVGSTLVLYLINKLFLIDESTTLSTAKANIASSIVQLEELILESREILEKLTPAQKARNRLNDTGYETMNSTQELLQRCNLLPFLNITAANNFADLRHSASCSQLNTDATNNNITFSPDRSPFSFYPLPNTETINDGEIDLAAPTAPLAVSTPSISP